MYSFLHSRTKAALFTIILVVLACAGRSYANITDVEKTILSHIDAGSMRADIDRLCSDQFRGRQAGSPESYKAANFLVSEFKHYGLSPLNLPGMVGYEQPLTMRYSLVRSLDDIKAILSYTVPGSKHAQNRIISYRSFNGSGGLDLHSKVVFIGYGISDPSEGYDDYAKVNATGKIVLCVQGRPKGVKLTKSFSGAQKILSAYQHGASACLICTPSAGNDESETNIGLSGSIADFPSFSLDKKISTELMSPSLHGRTLSPEKVADGTTGVDLRLQISLVCDPQRRTYNVVGALPGSDPKAGQEVVMVGAHYDHLGYLPTGDIFRGADDNASGTSVVLAVARAFYEAGVHPRRTIIFASWTAEEAGLIGSNYFASHPPFPLQWIVNNIELDMVGCGTPKSFMTTGESAYPNQYKFLAESANDLGCTLKSDAIPGASDHLSFSRRRVPVSLLYSAGVHPHYHTTLDTPSGLNSDVLCWSARLTALAIWRAANA